MKRMVFFLVILQFFFQGCASQIQKNTQLLKSAQNGDLTSVRTALNDGADINWKTNDIGLSALFIASEKGRAEVVRFLLKEGADPNEKLTNNGSTALLVASWYGHLEVVKILLDNGADVNAQQKKGVSAVHSAVRKGDMDLLKILLLHQADVNLQNVDGVTPLYIASSSGDQYAVEILLEAGADVNRPLNNGWTPICIAAYHNHSQVVKLLNGSGAKHSLHTYAALNNFIKVQEIVRSTTDVNCIGTHGLTPLHFAVRNGRLKIAQFLLDKGADPNNKKNEYGTAPMHIAVQTHDTAIAELLLENDADIEILDIKEYRPLHAAAQRGNIIMVDFLIKKGADINSCNKTGRTPLYDAVLNDHSESALLILNQGADTKKGHNQWTPIHSAVKNGNIEITQMLLEHGASLDATMSDTGESPIDIAYKFNKTDMMLFLAEYFGNNQVADIRRLVKAGDKSAAIGRLEGVAEYYDRKIHEQSRRLSVDSLLSQEDTFTKDLASTLNTTLQKHALKTGNASLMGQTTVNEMYLKNSQNKKSNYSIKANRLKHLYSNLKLKYELMAECIKTSDVATGCVPPVSE